MKIYIQPQLLIFPIRYLTKLLGFLSRTFQVSIYLERHLYLHNSPQARQKKFYTALL